MKIDKKKIKIYGKRTLLKTLSTKNATLRYVSWLNDPFVNKFLETRGATHKEIRDYIREKNLKKNVVLLGIFLRKNSQHIGNVKLEPIDFKKKSANYGLLIGDKNYWGKGIGTEVTKLITDWAFNKLGLKKVELGVIANNTSAINVYKKAGFKLLKIREKAINHEGVLFDEIVMAAYANESLNNHSSI